MCYWQYLFIQWFIWAEAIKHSGPPTSHGIYNSELWRGEPLVQKSSLH